MQSFSNIIIDLLTEATIPELKQKFYPKIPDNIFLKIISADTTTSDINKNVMGKYAKWLLSIYIKGNLKLEDLYKATEYFPLYAKLCQSKKIQQTDINSFQNLPQLFSVIEPFYNELQKNNQNPPEENGRNEVEKIYEDNEWLVLSLLTEAAAIYYGRGTQWCTSTTKSKNYFNDYIKMGPIYFIFDKKHSLKYQFGFSQNIFCDRQDMSVQKPITQTIGANLGLIDCLDKISDGRFLYLSYDFQDDGYYLNDEDGICKLINGNGECKFEYNVIGSYPYSLFDTGYVRPLTSPTNKIGYVNTSEMKIILEPIYDYIDMMYVQNFDKPQIDEDGQGFAGDYQKEVALFVVNIKGKGCGVINSNGNILSPMGDYIVLVDEYTDMNYPTLIFITDRKEMDEYRSNNFEDIEEAIEWLDKRNFEWIQRYEYDTNNGGLVAESKKLSFGNIVESTLTEDYSLAEIPIQIQKAEQETDTSPTDKQTEAGNYKKGHISVLGFDIAIENPKGSVRSGTDKNGTKWSITMKNSYGYFNRA
ncbi:hypothetical protein EZS27_010877, partial [termite gut metagenome]